MTGTTGVASVPAEQTMYEPMSQSVSTNKRLYVAHGEKSTETNA